MRLDHAVFSGSVMLEKIVQLLILVVGLLLVMPLLAFLLGLAGRIFQRQGWPRVVLSWVVSALGLVSGAGGILMGWAVRRAGAGSDFAGVEILTAVAGVLAGIYVFRLGRRLRSPYIDAAGALHGEWPVIYLRPFTADSQVRPVPRPFATMLPWNIQSEEEHLVRLLKRVGPVLAIGNSSDPLPPLCAARCYVGKEENGADLVTLLIRRAKLIVLYAGAGKRYSWEVETCLRESSLHRLVFLLPKSVDAFSKFRIQAGHLLPPLPEYRPGEGLRKPSHGTIGGFLWFDSSGAPRIEVLAERPLMDNPSSRRGPMKRALTPVLEAVRR